MALGGTAGLAGNGPKPWVLGASGGGGKRGWLVLTL
jgi:hypothetical protein